MKEKNTDCLKGRMPARGIKIASKDRGNEVNVAVVKSKKISKDI